MKKEIPFSRLPKYKQRIVIAKDTIKWVKSGIFTPQTQYYLHVELSKKAAKEISDSDQSTCDFQLNTLINEGKVAKCTVCAKGGMFMSHVMKSNHFTLHDADFASED